jgi:hypothetical protein
MMDANAFLKRLLLVAAVSALSMVNVAYAHGGGGHGTGGSSGGGGSASSGSSSSGGHSASGMSSGHSAVAAGHSAVAAGHSAVASKVSHTALDPTNVSLTAGPTHTIHEARLSHAFVQRFQSTGQYPLDNQMNNEDWRRKHQRLLFGFIRY